MLSLRPFQIQDSQASRFVFDVRSNPRVAASLYSSPPTSWIQHDAWVRKNVDHEARTLFIVEKDGEDVGYCQAFSFGFPNSPSAELGWALHPDYWGKGIGSEAVWAWLAYAKRFQYVDELRLSVKPSNEAALKIYSKQGFGVLSAEGDETRLVRDNDVDHAKLTFVGHAGFQVEYGKVRLLCDPWFNPAFYNSWSPRPANEHVLSRLDPPTHVYISHEHEDHFDEKFLITLDRFTKIIVPYWLESKIRRLGFHDVTPIYSDREGEVLNDEKPFAVRVFMDERKRDSALLIEVAGKRILNLNDCHLPTERLPKADVLFCQFSGAFHYPHCYDFPGELKAQKVAEVRGRYVRELIERAKATNAKVYVPSSGPPELKQDELNRTDSIFYQWNRVKEEFDVCDVAEMNPGDELLIGDRIAWIKIPKWFQGVELHQKLRGRLPAYFEQLNRKHSALLSKHPKAFKLEIGGSENYFVQLAGDMGFECNLGRKRFLQEINYTLKVDPRLMLDIIRRGGRWDAALLSNRILLHREIDRYDSDLFQILYRDRESDEGLKDRSEVIFAERTSYDSDSSYGKYKFQRFCPHMGQDLSDAPIENGIITCPRHGWKWDLKTGECLSGGMKPLEIGVP